MLDNPFVKYSKHDLEKLSKAKVFLLQIGAIIQSTYSNIRHFRIVELKDKTEVRIGIHGNQHMYHTLACGEDGIIKFTAMYVLLFDSNKRHVKILKDMLKKYPESKMDGSHFTLMLNIKDEADFYKRRRT